MDLDESDLERCAELMMKYSDLPMDFADSCLVFLAEQYNLNTIATIDRDFSVYRIQGRKKFKIVFS